MNIQNYLFKIYGQFDELISRLSLSKKLAFLGILGILLIGLTSIVFWSTRTHYTRLATQLNAEDSTQIIQFLKEKIIPFQVENGGKSILIPTSLIQELRLELATLGLPQSGIIGYELFDQQNFGTTHFIQKLNKKRALEGELVRTINTMTGVRRSRVHLAIPEKSTFLEDQKKPSASIVIDLNPGSQLSEKQVHGIGNLVARAVEGMDMTDVVVMNAQGKILSKNPQDPLAAETATQLDFRARLEADYEKRIESLLSKIVGDGRVVAKVTADLDFSRLDETQTLYDSDGAVIRSVERQNNQMKGSRPSPQGAVGGSSNNPEEAALEGNQVRTDTAKSNEIMNYEIPQTVRKTSQTVGSIKRLSVAVVIDAKIIKKQDEKGKLMTHFESWPEANMQEFQKIVSGAIGLDLKRGDFLEIKNFEFNKDDLNLEDTQHLLDHQEKMKLFQKIAFYTLIAFCLFLFFFFMVRPFIRWLTENTMDQVDHLLPQTVEALERLKLDPYSQKNAEESQELTDLESMKSPPEEVNLKEKVHELIQANPQKAALILKEWLQGNFKKSADLKEEPKKAAA